MMNNSRVRLMAEWEPQGGVLIAWPHENTDWAPMLSEVHECYIRMAEAISKYATLVVIAPDTSTAKEQLKHLPADKKLFFDVPTNDTWTRDYGVITTEDDNKNPILNDFGFNAWGNKFDSGLDNAVTSKMVKAGLLRGKYNDLNDFIMEGGSIESDGSGTIMVTSSCLLTDTRNAGLNKQQIEEKLKQTLGATKVLWVDKGSIIGDDTDGHIDTLARLAPNDTIIYCGNNWNTDDAQKRALDGLRENLQAFRTISGKHFNLLELPMPAPIYDENGDRLPATYANFLIINNAIIMPVYGQPQNDADALMAMRVAFPDYDIVPVDCRALIRQHGSLHCATMQLPSNVLPI